jgi:hypothetical protein
LSVLVEIYDARPNVATIPLAERELLGEVRTPFGSPNGVNGIPDSG